MKRIIAAILALILLASCAYAENLTVGSRGETVAQVQQWLIAQGYLSGEADGKYGDATAKAVSAFQSANGLTATGEVNSSTYAALEAGGQASVKQVQERLIELGYLTGEADGVYGSSTAGAVGKFQQDQGLTATGFVDDATREALLGAEAEEDVDVDFPLDVAAEPDEDAIVRAQQRLIDLGYLAGKADGIWGKKSAAALTLFQKVQGLTANGELDQDTKARLYSDDVTALPSALSSGDSGDEVAELQQKLIDLGFLSGKADGSYGKKTSAAVAAFQKHLIAQGQDYDGAITASGEATSLTLAILLSENYSSYLMDLNVGDENSEVERMERRLYILGYFDADADESYDAYAARALTAFQEKSGLTANGVADRETQTALYAADAAKADRWVSHDVALGETCGAVKDVQNALVRLGFMTDLADGVYDDDLESILTLLYNYLAERNSSAAEFFASRETLSADAQDILLDGDLVPYVEDVASGADKYETARVQTRLSSLFYLSKSGVDGIYGSSTASAIESFQTANGLTATGIADENTQAVLFSDDAVGDWTPYKLEISIDDQRVYVFELDENNVYQPIDSFICSTGLGDSTPTGIFTSTQPLDRWHYFTKYKCWAQYAYQIQGDILFHSVLYDEQDESTLRMGSVYALGGKASHGCIRLKVADAKWIFEHCEKGTIIVIY